ncbi:acyl-CoA dehydrogenase [Rhodococcus rhodnii]|uniref:Acyl-CoA dehydrogenase n=2 Tax=Rhodococcus rhodnii TaxID=38312 RepID=R7WHI2_9NOCA|nr:acyl-CoA dehydrogenase family protein [Rhodococcus rhodnii]EOM74512.1 acyl-CoA dehydrogenase [Rhodococcus rhodnii LMG 5362]TXG89197.1 acyl-CoA dehydrogenase [Rhodococcus rhodnii]
MHQSESRDGPITDEAFAQDVRAWLDENLTGRFASLRGTGGPGSEHEYFDERLEWDRHLAAAGWTCLGWPEQYGGRGVSIAQHVAFHEEYARAAAPARVSHVGEELLGPTLIAFGTEEQKQRFLPGIRNVTELWAQGYSEPGAGSDLADVATTARLENGTWVVNGQKIWTSLAHVADWAFVVARTEPGSRRHHGLSFLLVPLDQPGVTVRPIQQLTGTSEFNEVFFDDAVTDADLVVGEPGDGWKVAMALLTFERGVSTLGQQIGFARELAGVVEQARRSGTDRDPEIRDRIARAHVGLRVIRAHALRTLGGAPSPGDASVAKLLWAGWHRDLGRLAVDVRGPAGLVAPDHDHTGAPSEPTDPEHLELGEAQRLFLFTRADTIYGGSDEIQRNIISERVLGLPREARA